MKKKFNIYLITLKYTPKISVLFCLCFLFMYQSPACAKHIALWHPDFKLLDESKFLYQEPDDVIDDVPGCGIYSEGDLDACFEEIVQHLSGKLNHVDAEVFAKAASAAGEKASLDILSKAKQSASLAYLHLRQINCDHLQRSSNGGRMHTLRGVWACQFWMDLHRRSLLRETDGEPPMRVKPRRNGPHGPYRLADIWRRAGSGDDRLTRLQAQERLSLARLARAKRRVRRVLDDWDEMQKYFELTEKDVRQSWPALARYRQAQCDDYTPKLAAALGRGPTPREAAMACRILVNIEEATLLRYTFD